MLQIPVMDAVAHELTLHRPPAMLAYQQDSSSLRQGSASGQCRFLICGCAVRRCTNAEAQVGTRIVSLLKSAPTQSKFLALADYYLYGQVRSPHLPLLGTTLPSARQLALLANCNVTHGMRSKCQSQRWALPEADARLSAGSLRDHVQERA